MWSNATSDFVSDYAAKRAAQLERAKALKEQREATSAPQQQNIVYPPPPSSSSSAGGYPLPSSGAGYDNASNYAGGNNYQQRYSQPSGTSNTIISPPSQQPLGGSMNPNTMGVYPPPLGGHQQGSSGSMSQLLAQHAGVMMVTELDFRKAAKLGIITPDQARQLWAVLSDQATTPSSSISVAPGVRPCAATGPSNPSSSQQLYGQQPQEYIPQQYAPAAQPVLSPSAASVAQKARERYSSSDMTLQDDESSSNGNMAAPRSAKGAVGGKAGGRGGGKPDWNSDFASCYPQEEESPSTEGYGAPPPPKSSTNKKQPAPKASYSSKPEWKAGGDDGASSNGYQEDDGSRQRTPPVTAQRVPPKLVGSRQAGGKQQQDSAPVEEFMPAKQPPAKGSSAASKPGLDDRPARAGGNQQQPQQQQQQQQPQQSQQRQPAAKPAGRGVPLRQQRQQQQQQQEEAEMEPPQQSPEEIAEFLRLKEEQRRQFEDALNEASTREPLIPCNLCGRTFRESVIDRHENACRVANKKRKAYDVKGHRLEGIEGIDEVPHYEPPPPPRSAMGNARGGAPASAAAKLPKWKVQHLQFQAFIKNGAKGEAAPPPDDRVACPHCSRKFAEDVAARHIPKCSNIFAKPKSLARPGKK